MKRHTLAASAILAALLSAVQFSGVGQATTLVVNPALAGSSDENPGSDAQPLLTIGGAAALVQPGDVVQIHTGVYREAVVITASGTAEQPIRFEAAPGAHVVVTGADLIRQWQPEEAEEGENVYSTDWPHRFITWTKMGTHPSDDYHKLIGRAEQVFFNGYPLRQVLSREKLTRGTFFVDGEARRLHAQADSNIKLTDRNARVEASVRGTIWEVQGDYVVTRGITFRYAANPAQRGMAVLRGRGAVVEDCAFEWANATGAHFGNEDQVARRCTFRHNGQQGLTAARSHNLLVTECVVSDNNIKNFDRGWEAGALKICLARGVVLQRSQFVNNRGDGVWFDIGNEQCTVRNCLIAGNDDAGIFYEISFGLHAHDNVIVGNGFLGNASSWGANGGVSLSSSPGCLIERNLIVGNREGLQFREQNRQTPLIGRKKGDSEVWVWNHDQTIRNNVLAFNRDAHVWGWFDVNDERHWPAALQEPQSKEQTARPAADDAARYQAKTEEGRPHGLSLEKLAITFENNLYYAQPIEGLFVWGTKWRRHQSLAALDEVRRVLKLESGQLLGDLPLADYHARDFRLPADSPIFKLGCYPQGEVPGVLLGIRPE